MKEIYKFLHILRPFLLASLYKAYQVCEIRFNSFRNLVLNYVFKKQKIVVSTNPKFHPTYISENHSIVYKVTSQIFSFFKNETNQILCFLVGYIA